MKKAFYVAVVFGATGTVDIPFTKVPITIAENAEIDTLRDRLQEAEVLDISLWGLGRIKLSLAPCEPTEDLEAPGFDGGTIDLKKLVNLKLGLCLNQSLAEHDLIKDKPFAAQYASGLPNKARIVLVRPAPNAPATVPPVPGECCHILTSTKYSASCTYRTVPNLFPFSPVLFIIPYLSP
jgi:hypothetical protein